MFVIAKIPSITASWVFRQWCTNQEIQFHFPKPHVSASELKVIWDLKLVTVAVTSLRIVPPKLEKKTSALFSALLRCHQC